MMMIQDASQRRGRQRLGALLAGGAAAAVMLGGCGSASQPVDPIVVDGTGASIEQGLVTTACYTYQTSAEAEYMVNGSAAPCVGEVQWVGGTMLSGIIVAPQYDPADEDSVLEAFRSAGAAIQDTSTRTVGGMDAVVVDTLDGWGLPQRVVIVAMPEGRYVYEDQAFESLFIRAMSGDPHTDALLDAVLDSLEFRDAE